MIQRRSKDTKSSSLRCSRSVTDLCVEKKSLIIVNIPGVPSSRSSRGMEPYKLQTSRLQNPLMSSKLEVKSMNSCVFFKCAGTCVRMLFNEEQIQFNSQLNKIANKYTKKHPELSKAFKDNICCEPLPCSVYCLPKDHKKGELKGRPKRIHTNSLILPQAWMTSKGSVV